MGRSEKVNLKKLDIKAAVRRWYATHRNLYDGVPLPIIIPLGLCGTEWEIIIQPKESPNDQSGS